MNKTLIYIGIALVAFSCKAQNPVAPEVPLETNYYDAPQGAYFKDIDDEMDKYVGTWKYQNGTTEFIIEFRKVEMLPFDNGYYEDLLIGEYKYIENGMELVNTLPLLNDPSIIGRYYNISGRRIISPNSAYSDCTDCDPNEKRFELNFDDPDRTYLPIIIVLQYLEQYNPPRIKVTLLSTDSIVLPYENAPTGPRVPYGEYVLVKQ